MSYLHTDIRGQGFPLVLLHGWGFNSNIWQPLIPQLENKYQLFLIDLPGFGKSESILNYSFDYIIPNLLAKTPKEAYWLGWSLGGLIAMAIAIHSPLRVKKLI